MSQQITTPSVFDRAGILCPGIKTKALKRCFEVRLIEIIGLAKSIGLQVIVTERIEMTAFRPSTLFGKGKVEELAKVVEKSNIEIVIIDALLTPIQQRNLERNLFCKVIDRTGLILEIFGVRAKTKEGRLQVELAALQYQRSRLVRSWTHLERQRGGGGFMGGPGERQIESDRRQISVRIERIEYSLAKVIRTRSVQRAARKKVPYPIVAVVGYTNAGKSSLFNKITRANVKVKDLLFSTLDPTMRVKVLPNGIRAIFSDTVGFISDLPHELIAAFSATLEEVRSADIILNVCDASHPDSITQAEEVTKTLSAIGVRDSTKVLNVNNKLDLVESDPRNGKKWVRCRANMSYWVSALTGEGCDALLEGIAQYLGKSRVTRKYRLKNSDGASIAWLYRRGEILERHEDSNQIMLEVMLDPADSARFERNFLEDKNLALD